jgi:hypothetical protein
VQCYNGDLADVLESAGADLTNCGEKKMNGPMWWSAAWRRWRNDRDFKRRVKERENSDEALCGGSRTVVFRGF